MNMIKREMAENLLLVGIDDLDGVGTWDFYLHRKKGGDLVYLVGGCKEQPDCPETRFDTLEEAFDWMYDLVMDTDYAEFLLEDLISEEDGETVEEVFCDYLER